MKKNKQKVAMPAALKQKLMAATSMLLVAAIMMVSSTYAWFTLSTAPEVTGITTSVGANGNLEIALLSTNSFNNPDLITSNVGDSSLTKDVAQSNVTWGNLVDLSPAVYGLSTIKLAPAALNETAGQEGVMKLDTGMPLKTVFYGPDGRPDHLVGNTMSAIYTGNAFQQTYDIQDYGVRAIGTTADVSERELALRNARSQFTSLKATALNKAQDAFNAYGLSLASVALALQSSEQDTTMINADSVTAYYNIALALRDALTTTRSAYQQAILAALASASNLTDEAYSSAATAIRSATPSQLVAALGTNSLTIINTSDITNLNTAISGMDDVIRELSPYTTNGGTASQISAVSGAMLNSNCMMPETQGSKFYTVKNATNNSCLMATVADYVGGYGYSLTGIGGVTVTPNGAAKLAAMATAMSSLTAASSSSNAAATISDTYGYAIDFAFRTNAASSNLQLQTAGAQRVYGDSQSTATQGAGSKLIYAFSNGMTADQATKILKAIRVVFFDPVNGTIFATAAVNQNNIGQDSQQVSGELYLIKTTTTNVTKAITLGKDAYEEDATGNYVLKVDTYPAAGTVDNTTYTYSNYSMVVDGWTYRALPASTSTVETKNVVNELFADKTAITALSQNTVARISTLVYMDGDQVDNTATVNALSSGMLSLNLQFSSSADLKPMQNTALKTYGDIEGLATGAAITGDSSVNVGETLNLTAALQGNTAETENVDKIYWSSADDAIAQVNDSGVVTGVEKGSTTIIAIVRTNRGNLYSVVKDIIVLQPANEAYITLEGVAVSAMTFDKPAADTTKTLSVALQEGTTDTIDTVAWSSSDENVATIAQNVDSNDATLTFTGARGSTTITAKVTPAGSNARIVATFEVTVTNIGTATAVTAKEGDDAADLTFDLNDNYGTAQTVSFELTQTGEEADEDDRIINVIAASNNSLVDVTVNKENDDFTISVSASDVAADGAKVLAIVTTEGGLTSKVWLPVTVTATPGAITVTDATVKVGNDSVVTLTKESTTGENTTWSVSSSNDNIASADIGNGTVTIHGKAAGSTTLTLTAESNFGTVTKTINVTVEA